MTDTENLSGERWHEFYFPATGLLCLARTGTIRGGFWLDANEANAQFRLKFQQSGDDWFRFNMIHASDSPASFDRKIQFFKF